MVKNKRIIRKSKKVAVIIAIFFGMFSWTYTYKFDAWKFWLNLCLSFATFGLAGIIAWIWAIIDQATKDNDKFEYYGEY